MTRPDLVLSVGSVYDRQHRENPFDQLLFAQALDESLTLITRDNIFERYGVSVL